MNNAISQHPILAICYDFDKTLTPDDMQSQGLIQSLGYEDPDKFWNESNQLAKDNGMDRNSAYMWKLIQAHPDRATPEFFKKYGSQVRLFNGVAEWFQRINQYGKTIEVEIEHYIISSGLKEMIEGSQIAHEFKQIYACSYYYESGHAVWPAQLVNYTNKTQFLFRIHKGVFDVDDGSVNDYMPQDKIHVPFRNIVYIGDSDTDVPCMKLVNSHGGHSIGVFNSSSMIKEPKAKVYKMMREGRIGYFVPADYSHESGLERLLFAIIARTKYNDCLENFRLSCRLELASYDHDNSKEQRDINELIQLLFFSNCFRSTHQYIRELSKYSEFDDKQRDSLYFSAITNGQICAILHDEDIALFYKRILEKYGDQSQNAKRLYELLDV